MALLTPSEAVALRELGREVGRLPAQAVEGAPAPVLHARNPLRIHEQIARIA